MSRRGSSIHNPRIGQRMTFLETAAETEGSLLRLQCFHPPHSVREREHVHPRQENRFEVQSGTLTFSINGNEARLGPGSRIAIPAGTAHYFWNAGAEPAHYLQEFAPALRMEVFFETAFMLARAGRLRSDGSPRFLQLAVLMKAFSEEFRVTRPSPSTQTLIRLFAPVGRLFGYRDEYPAEHRSS
jgi:mannose-6-phosphate isomerase-like protein (cupin superfamily)